MSNLLDRAVAAISPERGARRLAARAQFIANQQALRTVEQMAAPAEVEASGRYHVDGVPDTRHRSASRTLRSLTSWRSQRGSALRNLPEAELHRIVGRSQDAYRNHTVARSIMGRMRTGIVGAGLRPHSEVNAEVLGIRDLVADQINSMLDEVFASWAEDPKECDIAGELDFYRKQDQGILATMLDGDMFVSTPVVRRTGGQWFLKTQEISAWRVSNPDNVPDRSDLVQGIERAADGYQLRVHVRRGEPDDLLDPLGAMIWDPLDVWGARTGRRRVMHVRWDHGEVGSVRCAPMLSPILEPLQQLETYKRSELMAAVVASMFTVFISRDPLAGGELDDDLNPLGAFAGAEDIPTNERDSAARERIELGSGTIVDLAPGEKPEIADPKRPNSNYAPYFRSIVDSSAAAVGLPGDIVLMVYNTSYAAARAAMLEAHRTFMTRRGWYVSSHSAPIRNLVIDEAVASGRIRLPGYADPVRRRAYQQAMWVGPARGSMDEEKEARAAAERIRIGISNEYVETAAMMGENWLRMHKGRARARFYKRRDGIFPGAEQGVAQAEPMPPDPEPATPSGGGNDA